MNFEKFDVVILITMSIAVVGMSFTFPALGLTSSDTNENDIPEFDISSDRFDLAGDFPDGPGFPSSGSLTLDDDEVARSNNHVDLDEDTNLLLLQDTSPSDSDLEVMLNDKTSGNSTSIHFNNSSIGDLQLVQDFGYEIAVELTDVQNRDSADLEWSVEWDVREEPDRETTGGWASRIPGLGAIIGAGEALASTLAWIGSIIIWLVQFIVELALNVVNLLVEAMIYLISLGSWLIGTYAEVVASAGSWPSVFVALPGILLFLELAKMVMIGISLLPTT